MPTATWSGQTSVSRATRSILTSAGLGHLAADTPEEFVRIAASLVKDPRALQDQRRDMRRRLLPTALLDHEGFTHSLESAYRQMWHTWAANGTRVALDA